MHRELELIKQMPFQPEPRKCFVWGKHNHKAIKKLGFDCFLVTRDDYQHLPEPVFADDNWHFRSAESMARFWRHKLLALQHATAFFDEFVFLDFDCTLNRELPRDFWDRFKSKESLQTTFVRYAKTQCPWRTIDRRTAALAAFIYIGDKSVPQKLLDISDAHPDFREETVITKYVESIGNFPQTEDSAINIGTLLDKHEAWCVKHRFGIVSTKPDCCFDTDVINNLDYMNRRKLGHRRRK